MAGASEILLPFLGALQAALSVLLTMGYGMAACYFGLLDQAAAKKFSKTSVTIFLPMLLTYNLGSELHAETIMRYVPILGESPGRPGGWCRRVLKLCKSGP